jgi:hypothetical protein
MSLTPDEIRAAAATHHELGPEYQSAVIESFLDKVGKEIDARVDARIGYRGAPQPAPYQPAPPIAAQTSSKAFALAVISMALGIPLTAIIVGEHYNIIALLVIWIALVAVNVAYGRSSGPSSSRPPQRH